MEIKVGQKAFYIGDVEDTSTTKLVYERNGQDLILEHTEVDAIYQGQGVGKMLVEYAVGYARKNGYQIIPMCSYAAKVFAKTPEFADVLKNK